ncbi:hypothetical protein PR048_025098 [Dryococelus australis]|uniref:Uncharacterized protein n=1 Tax=Dryococelus australis TaxID=614101 RepID=A0ABQ9GQC8_9NEOP|nr:hypothetical protein PR048_025098 [Dryococelus australis]
MEHLVVTTRRKEAVAVVGTALRSVEELLLLQVFYYALLQKRKTYEMAPFLMVQKWLMRMGTLSHTTLMNELRDDPNDWQLYENGRDCIYANTTQLDDRIDTCGSRSLCLNKPCQRYLPNHLQGVKKGIPKDQVCEFAISPTQQSPWTQVTGQQCYWVQAHVEIPAAVVVVYRHTNSWTGSPIPLQILHH